MKFELKTASSKGLKQYQERLNNFKVEYAKDRDDESYITLDNLEELMELQKIVKVELIVDSEEYEGTVYRTIRIYDDYIE